MFNDELFGAGTPAPNFSAKKVNHTRVKRVIALMKHTPTYHEIIAILAGIAVLIALALPEMVAEERSKLTYECQGNVHDLATALEMYSTDYGGRFPPTLEKLIPNYIEAIPTCPAADDDTYTQAYEHGSNPDLYIVTCQNPSHSILPQINCSSSACGRL